MRRALRTALAVVGLAAALYGAASLTGGWLGEPPWWTRPVHESDHSIQTPEKTFAPPRMEGQPGRERISAAVILAGLALFAWAAWPRRARTANAQ